MIASAGHFRVKCCNKCVAHWRKTLFWMQFAIADDTCIGSYRVYLQPRSFCKLDLLQICVIIVRNRFVNRNSFMEYLYILHQLKLLNLLLNIHPTDNLITFELISINSFPPCIHPLPIYQRPTSVLSRTVAAHWPSSALERYYRPSRTNKQPLLYILGRRVCNPCQLLLEFISSAGMDEMSKVMKMKPAKRLVVTRFIAAQWGLRIKVRRPII